MLVPSVHPRRCISSKNGSARRSSLSESPGNSTTASILRADCASAASGARMPAPTNPRTVLLVVMRSEPNRGKFYELIDRLRRPHAAVSRGAHQDYDRGTMRLRLLALAFAAVTLG